MSKKETINDLEKDVSDLRTRLYANNYVNDKVIRAYVQSLINARENPILTLPSGKQIAFSSLNQQQLEYLESLAEKTYKR